MDHTNKPKNYTLKPEGRTGALPFRHLPIGGSCKGGWVQEEEERENQGSPVLLQFLLHLFQIGLAKEPYKGYVALKSLTFLFLKMFFLAAANPRNPRNRRKLKRSLEHMGCMQRVCFGGKIVSFQSCLFLAQLFDLNHIPITERSPCVGRKLGKNDEQRVFAVDFDWGNRRRRKSLRRGIEVEKRRKVLNSGALRS